jgi:glycosyltransferase involved in cell wall biosynthesis
LIKSSHRQGNNMRILIVHNFYSLTGGEDIVYLRELDALKTKLGAENVFEYTASSKEAKMFAVLPSLFFSKKHYRNIRALISEHRIDLVHVHNFFPVLTASVFAAAKDAGAKLVHTVHNYRWWCIAGEFFRDGKICTLCAEKKYPFSGMLYKCYRKSRLQSIAAQLAFWLYKKQHTLEKTDAFFALTSFQKNKMTGLGLPAEKIYVKPNMIGVLPAAQSQREGYVFVGRLEPSKGIELLLATWVSLPSHFKLMVIGTGSLEKQLREKYPQANIIFKGECTQEETFALMRGSKYTIQPSIWYETFGLTIIESMRMGIPVIGFNIGTRPELIADGKTGFITTPENLSATLQSSFDIPGYEQLCSNAIAFAAKFDTVAVLDQQIGLYRSLVSA